MSLRSVILLLSLRAVALGAPPDDERLRELSSQARQAQQQHDYARAAAAYREMLRLVPGEAGLWANVGLMDHLQGHYEEAGADFREALKRNPQLFQANFFAGVDLLSEGQPARALPYLEKARALNVGESQVMLALGRAWAMQSEPEKANDCYDSAARMDNRSAGAWFGLGATWFTLMRRSLEELHSTQESPWTRALLAQTWEEKGRWDEAIQLREQAMHEPAGPPCPRAALGLAELGANQPDKAGEQFRLELQTQPGCLTARLGMARMALNADRPRDAFLGIAEAWERDRGFVAANRAILLDGLEARKAAAFFRVAREMADSESWRSLVRALESAEAADVAASADPGPAKREDRDSAGQAAAGFPRAPQGLFDDGQYGACSEELKNRMSALAVPALMLLARCAFLNGDYRAAFAASSAALRHRLAGPEALYWRVQAARRLSVDALTRAGLADPGSARVHMMLGEIYREQENLAESRDEFLKALEIARGEPRAHLGLARTLEGLGEWDSAIRELQAYLPSAPQDPDASFMMGRLLVGQARFDEAFPYATAALKVDPQDRAGVHALLGKIYEHQQRLEDALRELKQALPADEDGSYHYRLSRICRALGRDKEAQAALSESKILHERRSHLAEAAQERRVSAVLGQDNGAR
jgi:tetratricopeptide (TPR) repeat protein